MNNTLILMLLVLIFEAGVLLYFFKWSPLKSVGMSVLINLCSSIAIVIVQNFVSMKLPGHVWYIYMVKQQYYQLMLPLMGVAFVTTVLSEFFLCNMFIKNIPLKKIWLVIIGMNVVTILFLASTTLFNNRPEVAPGYTLVERADWLTESGETLRYIDWQSQTLVAYAIGTTNGTVVAQAVPMAGYRVTTENLPVIILTTNNTAAVIAKTNITTRTPPVKIISCRQAAISPSAEHVALYAGNTVHVFNLSTAQPVNSFSATAAGEDSYVCWSTNGNNILYGSSSSGIYSRAWNSTNTEPIAATSDEAQHATVFDKELHKARTNSFSNGETTATVTMYGGITISTPTEESIFYIDGKGTSSIYFGIGFIDNGSTFLFQLFSYRREIMALNIETGQAGHVAEGIMATLDIAPYQVPPAPAQP